MEKIRKTTMLLLIFVALLSFAVEANLSASYWQRMADDSVNSILVYNYQYEYQAENLEIIARIPQLTGKDDFNYALREHLEIFVSEIKEAATIIASELDYSFHFPYEGLLDYEVKLNRGGLLSIVLTSYVYTGGAHGMTYHNYINLDLINEREIAFRQLFDTEDELERAASIIAEEIATKPDHFFIDTFTVEQFQADQGFYLLDNKAVICFGLYEITPYYLGIQEFEIAAP